MVVAEILPEALGVTGFHVVIELVAYAPGELVHQAHGIDKKVHGTVVAYQVTQLVKKINVGAYPGFRLGPLHLDDHLVAIGQHRPVHLPDGSGCDGHLIEFEEETLDGQVEFLLDGRFNYLKGKICSEDYSYQKFCSLF
jgi:hypothetical protein